MLVCVRHFISFFFLRLSNFKRILLPLLLCSIPLFLAYTTVLRCYSLFIVVASRSACCTFSFHLCLLAGVNRKLYNFSCFIFTMTTCSISDRKKKEDRYCFPNVSLCQNYRKVQFCHMSGNYMIDPNKLASWKM